MRLEDHRRRVVLPLVFGRDAADALQIVSPAAPVLGLAGVEAFGERRARRRQRLAGRLAEAERQSVVAAARLLLHRGRLQLAELDDVAVLRALVGRELRRELFRPALQHLRQPVARAEKAVCRPREAALAPRRAAGEGGDERRSLIAVAGDERAPLCEGRVVQPAVAQRGVVVDVEAVDVLAPLELAAEAYADEDDVALAGRSCNVFSMRYSPFFAVLTCVKESESASGMICETVSSLLGLNRPGLHVRDDQLQLLRVRHVDGRVVDLVHHAAAQREPDLRLRRVRGADALLARAGPLRVAAGRAGRPLVGVLRARRGRQDAECERQGGCVEEESFAHMSIPA